MVASNRQLAEAEQAYAEVQEAQNVLQGETAARAGQLQGSRSRCEAPSPCQPSAISQNISLRSCLRAPQ